jgi:hypothetical protein
MLRTRLLMLMPFLARWFEASATTTACCGACPTCVGVTAGSLLLPVVFRDRAKPQTPNDQG